jgi:hypothetical protein
MDRVLCILPNASESIDGVAFTRTPEGMLSEVVSPEAAARFASIPGYSIVEEAPPASMPTSAAVDGEVVAHQPPAKPARRKAH